MAVPAAGPGVLCRGVLPAPWAGAELPQHNFSFYSHSGFALRSRETKMPAGAAWCQPALLVLLCSVPLWAAGISCRNEDGEAVDW